eukprot:12904013-Prorocentrum_lima.AAC.1
MALLLDKLGAELVLEANVHACLVVRLLHRGDTEGRPLGSCTHTVQCADARSQGVHSRGFGSARGAARLSAVAKSRR